MTDLKKDELLKKKKDKHLEDYEKSNEFKFSSGLSSNNISVLRRIDLKPNVAKMLNSSSFRSLYLVDIVNDALKKLVHEAYTKGLDNLYIEREKIEPDYKASSVEIDCTIEHRVGMLKDALWKHGRKCSRANIINYAIKTYLEERK
jgi:hypothetical protein